MKAVITVIGGDMVGILARVATICAGYNVNVLEVTQSILQGTFAMIMVVDVEKSTVALPQLSAALTEAMDSMGLTVQITRQELFDAMHRI